VTALRTIFGTLLFGLLSSAGLAADLATLASKLGTFKGGEGGHSCFAASFTPKLAERAYGGFFEPMRDFSKIST